MRASSLSGRRDADRRGGDGLDQLDGLLRLPWSAPRRPWRRPRASPRPSSAAAAASSAGSWAVFSARALSAAALAALSASVAAFSAWADWFGGRVGGRLGRGRLRRELLGGLERRPGLAGRGDLRLERLVELLRSSRSASPGPARPPRPCPGPASEPACAAAARVLERGELPGQRVGLGLGGGQEPASACSSRTASGAGLTARFAEAPAVLRVPDADLARDQSPAIDPGVVERHHGLEGQVAEAPRSRAACCRWRPRAGPRGRGRR